MGPYSIRRSSARPLVSPYAGFSALSYKKCDHGDPYSAVRHILEIDGGAIALANLVYSEAMLVLEKSATVKKTAAHLVP